MGAWHGRNKKDVIKVREFCLSLIADGKMIQIDTYFCFPKSKLFIQSKPPKDSKKKIGDPKKLDGSNRIKPTHDAIATMLNIDDCYFWAGHFEKIEAPDETILLEFKERQPRTLSELTRNLSKAKR